MGGALATGAHRAMEMPLTQREREASRLNREVGRAEVGAAVEEEHARAFGAACDGERSLMRRDMAGFAEERGR